MRLLSRLILLLLLAALAVASWDFLRFVERADARLEPVSMEGAQAVAALTGASDARIITGIRLADELELPLLISGVHPSATTSDIARIAGVSDAEIACCVRLGHAAATTEGNGQEIASWARQFGITSLIVVTSDYHMERALYEIRRAMPEGTLLPYAAPSLPTRPRNWPRDPVTAQRMLSEWVKFRVATLRAERAPREAPAPAPAETPPSQPLTVLP